MSTPCRQVNSKYNLLFDFLLHIFSKYFQGNIKTNLKFNGIVNCTASIKGPPFQPCCSQWNSWNLWNLESGTIQNILHEQSFQSSSATAWELEIWITPHNTHAYRNKDVYHSIQYTNIIPQRICSDGLCKYYILLKQNYYFYIMQLMFSLVVGKLGHAST